MSLSEERMMILKMLQEGRISSDEAARLLEALDGGQKQAPGGSRHSGYYGTCGHANKTQHNYYDEVSKVRERINEWRRDFSKNYSQKDFDKMVDDFSSKAEKVGKEVASATFGLVDKVVDFMGSFVETGAFNIFGSCVLVEKTFEAAAAEGADLELQATNGQITVKKHNESNILIKAKIRTPQSNEGDVLVFTSKNNMVSLKLAKPDTFNLSVSYEVFVPAVKFNKLLLVTKNSKISVEDTLSEEFTAITKTGAIDMMGVNSTKVTAETKNAKVTINYLIGKDITINNKNAMIDIKNIRTAKLDTKTTNAKILLENLQPYDDINAIELVLKTKNADIKCNMNDTEDKGCRIKARTTSGGDINLLVPNILYREIQKSEGSGKQIEAETENYNNADIKVHIIAETQNGYIEVIK